MFSYVDLVRVEIALEAEEQFGVTIPDEETDGWRTLGDAARSVAGRAGGAATEAEVFDWLRTLIAEGYGVAEEDVGEVGLSYMTGPRPLPPVSTLLTRALGLPVDKVVDASNDPALEIIETPGRARCRACGAGLTLDRPFGRCACGGSDLEWLSGEELKIKEMEVA